MSLTPMDSLNCWNLVNAVNVITETQGGVPLLTHSYFPRFVWAIAEKHPKQLTMFAYPGSSVTTWEQIQKKHVQGSSGLHWNHSDAIWTLLGSYGSMWCRGFTASHLNLFGDHPEDIVGSIWQWMPHPGSPGYFLTPLGSSWSSWLEGRHHIQELINCGFVQIHKEELRHTFIGYDSTPRCSARSPQPVHGGAPHHWRVDHHR